MDPQCWERLACLHHQQLEPRQAERQKDRRRGPCLQQEPGLRQAGLRKDRLPEPCRPQELERQQVLQRDRMQREHRLLERLLAQQGQRQRQVWQLVVLLREQPRRDRRSGCWCLRRRCQG